MVNILNNKSCHVFCYVRVEKENDLIVASRQKYNGKVWSDKGSGTLSVIKGDSINMELMTWNTSKKILFKMAA